ncbi:MAG: acyl-CoA synthetase FdrA [Anaerolineae bacterium]|nr:acyl-CoA synthetase FdrA [Anaerolineae bacterium]
MTLKVEIRPGTYFDSIVLMQLQRKLAALPGIDDAGVVMATPANKELLKGFDLLSQASLQAGPDDLLIVVKSDDENAAMLAIGQVDLLLQEKRSAITQEFRPHSLNMAVKQLPNAAWVLISTPGRYATNVVNEALDLGKNVFLYSDNVSQKDEIQFKKKAREKGLLVMGPDCGTAIINGVGLGFANRVRTGEIGLVAASGTGLQAVTTHIHNLGGGVSQAIGTGGRDLKSEVGAITAIQGLDILAQDENTKVIVLVSKPPAAEIAAKILATARAAGKPIVIDFIGYPPPARKLGNLHFAISLEDTAKLAVDLAKQDAIQEVGKKTTLGFLRGLFSGGTLAYEAMLGLQNILTPLFSNVPISKHQVLDDPLHSKGHTVIDLGEDLFTVGRLHPMMDNDLRLRRFRQEVEDPDTKIILLDIVLGEGAHPNPVSEIGPEIKAAKLRRKDIDFLAIVIGTEEDPQDLLAQIEQLDNIGVQVFRSTNEAVSYINEHYAARLEKSVGKIAIEDFKKPLAAINVGLETFYESVIGQGAQAIHVDWKPPAGGNEKLLDILAKMKN